MHTNERKKLCVTLCTLPAGQAGLWLKKLSAAEPGQVVVNKSESVHIIKSKKLL